MKIAVPYENGQVFPHFGHTEKIKVYEINSGKVVSTRILDTDGHGHSALAGFLADNATDILICGGIGGGAQAALAEAGIRLYGGVQGDADEAVNAFLSGTLVSDPDFRCEHGKDGHECGVHECGKRSCHA